MMGLRGNRPPEMPQSSRLSAFGVVVQIVEFARGRFAVANSHAGSVGSRIEGELNLTSEYD